MTKFDQYLNSLSSLDSLRAELTVSDSLVHIDISLTVRGIVVAVPGASISLNPAQAKFLSNYIVDVFVTGS